MYSDRILCEPCGYYVRNGNVKAHKNSNSHASNIPERELYIGELTFKGNVRKEQPKGKFRGTYR